MPFYSNLTLFLYCTKRKVRTNWENIGEGKLCLQIRGKGEQFLKRRVKGGGEGAENRLL